MEWQQQRERALSAPLGEDKQMLIDALKGLKAEGTDLDRLVELSAGAKALSAEYEAHAMSEPAWLSDAKRTLSTEIRRQNADKIEMELRQLRAANEQDKTAQERRQDRDKRIAELEAARAGQPVGA